MRKQNKRLIVLTGGGSGGPVSPLLAVAAELHRHSPQTKFLFIGTKRGVERHMAKKAGIPFVHIAAAKLRRYFSIFNIFIPLQLLVGFVQAYRILSAMRPQAVLGTGGFVQVPVCWAAWILGIPVFLHQQDVVPSLSNKLCAPTARNITVSFPESVNDFPHGWILRHLHDDDRVRYTGNPVRDLQFVSQKQALEHFHLDGDYPTLLIMTGGTGALSLNQLIDESLPGLTKFFNVIHQTGKGKQVSSGYEERYQPYEFIDDMGLAFSAADMVLSRAGLSTITELALAKKPALLVPLPGTHQEINARYLNERDAALALDQTVLTPDNLVILLRAALHDHALLKGLGNNLHKLMPQDASERVAKVVLEALK